MNKDKVIKKVLAKLEKQKMDPQKIYETEEVQSLISDGTKKYPDYNSNSNDSDKVVKHVLKHLKPEYKSKELANKVLDGIT